MWSFERRFVPAEDITEGLLPVRFMPVVQVLIFMGLIFAAFACGAAARPELAIALAGLAVVLARLATVDLAYNILPDVYTLPLVALGLGYSAFLAPGHGFLMGLVGAVAGFGIALAFAWTMAKVTGGNSGMGGGDIKFLAAVGAFSGAPLLGLAMFIGCGLTFFISLFFHPREMHFPFGPGLALGLWAALCFELLMFVR